MESKRVTKQGEDLDVVEVESDSPKGGAGGLGYPTHPQGENATDPVDETLSVGGRGVDVSGVQLGSGNTGMTITPSLSKPKK